MSFPVLPPAPMTTTGRREEPRGRESWANASSGRMVDAAMAADVKSMLLLSFDDAPPSIYNGSGMSTGRVCLDNGEELQRPRTVSALRCPNFIS